MPIDNPYAIVVDAGEGHITILPFNYDSIGAGAWAIRMYTSQALSFAWINTTYNDLDNISYKVFLQAGTYSLRVLHFKAPAGGIVDIDIDDTEVLSFDGYAGVDTWNQVASATGIVIATSGLKTLKVRLHGKNPSSGNWIAYIGAITLWRTA